MIRKSVEHARNLRALSRKEQGYTHMVLDGAAPPIVSGNPEPSQGSLPSINPDRVRRRIRAGVWLAILAERSRRNASLHECRRQQEDPWPIHRVAWLPPRQASLSINNNIQIAFPLGCTSAGGELKAHATSGPP